MFCPFCGNSISDASKFCPFCGKVMESIPAPQPVPVEPVYEEIPVPVAEAPVYPEVEIDLYDEPVAFAEPQVYEEAPAPVKPAKKSGKKKGSVGLIIGGAAVLAVIIAVAVLLLIFGRPEAVVGRAFQKSANAYTDAFAGMGLEDAAAWSEKTEYNTSMAVELVSVDEYYMGSDIPTGLGIRAIGSFSLEQEDCSVVVTPYYGSVDIVDMDVAFQGNKMYIHVPELLGDDYFGVNTETLGEDLYNNPMMAGQMDPSIQSLGFNIFELITMVREMSQPDEEALAEFNAATEAFVGQFEIEKGDSKEVEVNGEDLKCSGYVVTIPEDAMEDYLDAVEDYLSSMDAEGMYKELFKAIGMPDDVLQEMDFSEMDMTEAVDVLREAVKELGDVELDVYINGGYIVAVETKIEGVKFGLYLGGGDEYVDDLSFVIKADGEEMVLESSGNHSGKDGTYSDETTLEVPGVGTVFQSEFSYSPKEEEDNFEYSITINDGYSSTITFEMAGQYTVNQDTVSMDMEEVILSMNGMEVMELSVQYALEEYDPVVEVNNEVMILELSTDEMMALAEKIEGNMMSWATEMMNQIPELFM